MTPTIGRIVIYREALDEGRDDGGTNAGGRSQTDLEGLNAQLHAIWNEVVRGNGRLGAFLDRVCGAENAKAESGVDAPAPNGEMLLAYRRLHFIQSLLSEQHALLDRLEQIA